MELLDNDWKAFSLVVIGLWIRRLHDLEGKLLRK